MGCLYTMSSSAIRAPVIYLSAYCVVNTHVRQIMIGKRNGNYDIKYPLEVWSSDLTYFLKLVRVVLFYELIAQIENKGNQFERFIDKRV